MHDDSRRTFRPSTGATRVLIMLVGALVLTMMAYCYYVSFQGIGNDAFFFNFVELLPLATMTVVFWISWLFRSKSNRS